MPPPLHPSFFEFTAPKADRFSLLVGLLKSEGMEPAVVELSGSRHIIVGPSGRGPSRQEGHAAVLVAHYDRAAGSPGANDNGAAVFQLMEAARRLRAAGKRGWRVVFTDNEEAAGSEGVHGQGAYALGLGFKDIGLGNSRFYIFDACGRGDTLVVSTAVDHLLRGSEGAGADRTLHAVRSLRTRVLSTARGIPIRRCMLVPTPFSDDAGFFAAGLAAQTITVLPSAEAESLAAVLRGRPALAARLVNRDASKADGSAAEPGPIMPATWQDLNTPRDTTDTLTPAIFPVIADLAYALCGGSD